MSENKEKETKSDARLEKFLRESHKFFNNMSVVRDENLLAQKQKTKNASDSFFDKKFLYVNIKSSSLIVYWLKQKL